MKGLVSIIDIRPQGEYVMQQSIRCPNCGMFNAIGQQVCSYCRNLLLGVCASCGASIDPRVRFCQVCGMPFNQSIPQPNTFASGNPQPPPQVSQKTSVAQGQNKVQKKYYALRIISSVYKIIGWTIIIGGWLFSILFSIFGAAAYMMSNQSLRGLAFLAVPAGIISGFSLFSLIGLPFLALSEGIYVFIDIENNTRALADRKAQTVS